MMEVIYRRPDGGLTRSLALLSFRSGPLGEWILDGAPMNELKGEVIYKGSGGPLADDMWERLTNRTANREASVQIPKGKILDPEPLHPNAIEAAYCGMRDRGQFYIGRLGGPPMTIDEWRDRELARWRDHSRESAQ